jgi:hypothetical protein
MVTQKNWRADFSVKKLFTLWSKQKWSAVLGVLMLLTATVDVVFTLLDVSKFGLAGEINPLSRIMIGAGGLFIIAWVAIDLASTLLLYTPLISLFLMLPTSTREGRASTVISLILSARITVSLFNVTIFNYSVLQAASALLIVGVVLTFLIRFVMKNGDYLSWNTAKSALHGLGVSLSSPIVGLSHLFGSRRQKPVQGTRLAMRPGEMNTNARRSPPFVQKRDKRRIAIIAALTVIMPFIIVSLMNALIILSGYNDLPPSERSLWAPYSSVGGWVFLGSFAIAIVGVATMAILLMKLFEAVKGKTVLVDTR